jgi:hypothetical protein
MTAAAGTVIEMRLEALERTDKSNVMAFLEH